MATTTDSRGRVSVPAERVQRDGLGIISLILAIIGLGIAGYLAWAKITETSTICIETGAFNCDLVQGSIYSRIGPIPVVFLGLGGYAVIFLLLLLGDRVPQSRTIIFVLALG